MIFLIKKFLEILLVGHKARYQRLHLGDTHLSPRLFGLILVINRELAKLEMVKAIFIFIGNECEDYIAKNQEYNIASIIFQIIVFNSFLFDG